MDMTDHELDLVEELRLLAELADHSELGLVMISGRSFFDAADEIEGLRARLASAEVEW
jgi:hypothetical protein